MIQSCSSKKHSQQAIIAVCQGRSSLNARQRLCTESDCRTSTTGPRAIPADTQFLPFPLAAQHGKRGAAGTHLCCAPGLSPVYSPFSSPLEQPQGCGGCLWTQQLPRKGCAVRTHSPPYPISDLPGCCLAGPRDLLPLRQSLPFLAALCSLPPTSLSQCSWSQFHYATFQSSWAICFHSPAFLSLSVFIVLTPVPHSLHMACPSF